MGRSQRDGSSKGDPVPPTPGRKQPWWQQPGRLNAAAVPWQGHSGQDLSGGRLILGALRRGYFGPFALCESPAIFQPCWGYFRGRVIYVGWDNAAAACLGAWSPKPCWVHPPSPSRVQGGCPGCLLGIPAALVRCQGCPQQGAPAWSPSHRPATFLGDRRVGLGAAWSSSSSASQERWMRRGWKWWCSWQPWGEGHLHFGGVLGAEHPMGHPLPTTLGSPSPKPAASEPARQKPACFGVVRAT